MRKRIIGLLVALAVSAGLVAAVGAAPASANGGGQRNVDANIRVSSFSIKQTTPGGAVSYRSGTAEYASGGECVRVRMDGVAIVRVCVDASTGRSIYYLSGPTSGGRNLTLRQRQRGYLNTANFSSAAIYPRSHCYSTLVGQPPVDRYMGASAATFVNQSDPDVYTYDYVTFPNPSQWCNYSTIAGTSRAEYRVFIRAFGGTGNKYEIGYQNGLPIGAGIFVG